MGFVPVFVFLACTWGLGFSVLRLARAGEQDSFLERNVMRIGIGLSSFVVLGVIFNALGIPLDYRVFLVFSGLMPAYELLVRKGFRKTKATPSANSQEKTGGKAGMKLKLSDINAVVVLVIFAATLIMYLSGAFRYPYLEDDDPWGHASAVKYVSVEKTANDPATLDFHYMDPYPPGYDMVLGILNQVSSSTAWTLKFFNALFISLSIMFFYFFTKEFFGNRNKALFAAFVLASVPAYLSHFIWAPALAMAVFSQAMYSLEMLKHDRKWWAVAGVCFAAILLSHPTHAVKLTGLVLIYVGVKAVANLTFSTKSLPLLLRQLQPSLGNFAAVAFGVFLSLFWWAAKWKGFFGVARGSFRAGSEAVTGAVGSSGSMLAKLLSLPARIFNAESGTATRVYLLRDFAVVQGNNMINNPVGLGFFAFVLMVAGIVSAASKIVMHLPKRKAAIAAAAAAVIVLAVIIASNTYEYQTNLYETGSRFAQFLQSPPSYASVFLMSLMLSSLAVAFVLSIAAIIILRRKSHSQGDQGDQENQQNWQSSLVIAAILLGWLLFTFLGVNSRTFNLPVGLFAFRFWMIFAIPAAMLAAEGLFSMLGLVKALKLDAATATTVKLAIIAVVVAGVLFTSAKQKYDTNTSCWPSGAFWSGEFVLEPGSNCPVQAELLSYQWLKTLPAGTKVFTFSNPDQVIGFDKYSCGWCAPEYGMRQRFYNVTASELNSFMAENSYEYLILGGIEARNYGLNRTVQLINEFAESRLFTVAYNGQSAVVFRTA
ncbi:glycosyltransferase family 39 protein [Candidatus Woesearchaeota archaeon]|nr:glycosyltransferase family 39 protein [Candidatus Woesearchaeota archaeon]